MGEGTADAVINRRQVVAMRTGVRLTVIGVDGDNTLWRCLQTRSTRLRRSWASCRRRSPPPRRGLDHSSAGSRFAAIYGYGVTCFVLCGVEAAALLAGPDLSGQLIEQVLRTAEKCSPIPSTCCLGAAHAAEVSNQAGHRLALAPRGIGSIRTAGKPIAA